MLFLLAMLWTVCLGAEHSGYTAVWLELNKPFANQTSEGDMMFESNANNSIETRYLPKGLQIYFDS